MIILANSLHIPLQDKKVHCVISSPPYWGLRNYGVAGQLGLEKTPSEYVQNMVKVFREVRRVLRDDGTLWLNMGDSYAGSGGAHKEHHANPGLSNSFKRKGVPHWGELGQPGNYLAPLGLKPKDLCGIPWRLAFALQADGWYLRSDIIWSKPNPMPESVSGCAWEKHRVKVKAGGKTGKIIGGVEHWNSGGRNLRETEWQDCPGCSKCNPNDGYVLSWNAGRPTKAHEYIFLLTKSPHYFFDQEAVREPTQFDPRDALWGTTQETSRHDHQHDSERGMMQTRTQKEGFIRMSNPAGRNIRTVWNIATQSFSGAHFATFPEELVRRCLFAGTSEKGCCPKCGGPWVRAVEKESFGKEFSATKYDKTHQAGPLSGSRQAYRKQGLEGPPTPKTLGWRPSCDCGEERAVPCVVFDPFFGSGTVGVVAQQYHRRFIGLELKPEYIKMAQNRVNSQPVAML